MSRAGKKNGVPDRWSDYRPVGRRLHGTRFIAFKVPLKQTLNRQLQRPDAFGPWELLDAVRRDDEELGLIVDLTFTTRYYGLQDVPESLLFVKIFTAGHEVPSDATILSFKRAVRRFLRDNADNDKLIGVHCTHGLNRTGYLICRYLIDVDGMDPKEAVELFNSSRGHAIERQNYLDDLQRGPKRSNEGMEEPEQEPMRGCAARRPRHDSLDPDGRDERRAHGDERRAHGDERRAHGDSWRHRSTPPRGTSHRSHHRPARDGLLPDPPLLPPPPCRPLMEAPFHPYRWTPPHSDSERRRPPRSEESRHRYPPSEPEWGRPPRLQEDRRRGPMPPPLPRYSPRWTSGPSGCEAPEGDWDPPKMRRHHRHRVNGYDH